MPTSLESRDKQGKGNDDTTSQGHETMGCGLRLQVKPFLMVSHIHVRPRTPGHAFSFIDFLAASFILTEFQAPDIRGVGNCKLSNTGSFVATGSKSFFA